MLAACCGRFRSSCDGVDQAIQALGTNALECRRTLLDIHSIACMEAWCAAAVSSRALLFLRTCPDMGSGFACAFGIVKSVSLALGWSQAPAAPGGGGGVRGGWGFGRPP